MTVGDAIHGHGVVSQVLKEGPGALTLCFCGVMARGAEQFGPILTSLPGKVVAIHAEGLRYDADVIHWRALEYLEEADSNLQFNLVGASLGGVEVPYVVNYFRDRVSGVNPRNIHAVLVDAPAGLDTILNPLAKAMQFKPVAETLATGLWFMNSPKDLPKDNEITSPNPEQVKAQARQFMSGHKFGMLMRQTYRMIDVWDSGELPLMCEAMGPDVRATYVACKMGNGVIRQPLAADRWQSAIRQLKHVDVPATHCGFLQNQPEFRKVLRERVFTS